jgi:CheY-like chemotaxis protein
MEVPIRKAHCQVRPLSTVLCGGLTERLAVKPQMATILIIDDNSATRNMLRTALSHAGYTVLVAATGVDGLEQCQEHQIDLILTDILMPGTDGLTVIAILKRGRPHVKIIAMTGASDQKDFLNTAKVLGAHAIIQKPVDLSHMREMVKKELGEASETPSIKGTQNARIKLAERGKMGGQHR